MTTRNGWQSRAVAVAAMLLMVTAMALYAAAEGSAEGEGVPEGATLERVEAIKVCMVNDQVFVQDQIPVEVDGKTYYGCCIMCKDRLAQDESARTGLDPVTGSPVDKATAVIGMRPDGSVLYFESEESLAEYQERAAGTPDA